MKKIVIFMLLLALPVIARTYDLKKIIIGKWNWTEYRTNLDQGEMVFDGGTMVSVSGNVMDTYKYKIINNQLCVFEGKEKACMEAVFVSEDEIYFPKGKFGIKRIKE